MDRAFGCRLCDSDFEPDLLLDGTDADTLVAATGVLTTTDVFAPGVFKPGTETTGTDDVATDGVGTEKLTDAFPIGVDTLTPPPRSAEAIAGKASRFRSGEGIHSDMGVGRFHTGPKSQGSGLTPAVAPRDSSSVPKVCRSVARLFGCRTVAGMARPLRPQIEDGIYHVTSRGNRRQDVYADAADQRYFLQLLTRVTERYGWLIHAYCLMTNHYHLLVETPQPNISAGMQRLNSMHAEWFNWRHGFSGHLFQGRFHSAVVETDSHFMEVCRYVVLNPVRAGICDEPVEYRWSSYRATAAAEPLPPFLTMETIIELFGGRRDIASTLYSAFVAAGIDEAVHARTGHVSGLTPALAV